MGFYTYNGGRIGTGDIDSKSGVFDQKRAQHNSLSVAPVYTSQIVNAGLAGYGTSATTGSYYLHNITLTSSNYSAGKRLVIVLFGFRDSGGAVTNGRVPLITSASLGGTSLTIISQGQSDYNDSCIAAGFVDLTGTQTFNASFTTAINGGDGYTAFMVFDGVTAWNYIGDDTDVSSSTTQLGILGNQGVPTGDGQTVRVVGLNASNPTSAPIFTPSDGFSYTSWFSQDNGTREWSVGYYYVGSGITGEQNPISGTVSGVTAPNGMAFAVADFKIHG